MSLAKLSAAEYSQKKASKLYKEKFEAVLKAVEFVASPECKLDDPAKQAHVRQLIDALPAPKKEDSTGLRLDLTLENEVRNGLMLQPRIREPRPTVTRSSRPWQLAKLEKVLPRPWPSQTPSKPNPAPPYWIVA